MGNESIEFTFRAGDDVNLKLHFIKNLKHFLLKI